MPVYAADEGNGVSGTDRRTRARSAPRLRRTLQLGIGAIPEALTAALLDHECGPLRFAGMATDSMVDLHEAGRLDTTALVPEPAILAAELMGGPRLMAFAHENPLVGVHPSTWSHDALASVARLARFVSINSAIEVDLTGQVNAESVGTRQVSGVGGSVDYVEAASRCPREDLRIVALPSTTSDGRRSRIVSRPPRPWRRGHGVAKHSRRRRDGARRCRAAGPHAAGRTGAAAMLRVAHPDLARRPRSSDH